MSDAAEPDPPPLAYATPVRTTAWSSVWASAVLAATALGLVVLGGCFLIGVLALYEPPILFGASTPIVWTPGRVGLCAALYAAALVCFASAALILIPTVRTLIRAAADRAD